MHDNFKKDIHFCNMGGKIKMSKSFFLFILSDLMCNNNIYDPSQNIFLMNNRELTLRDLSVFIGQLVSDHPHCCNLKVIFQIINHIFYLVIC